MQFRTCLVSNNANACCDLQDIICPGGIVPATGSHISVVVHHIDEPEVAA